MEARVALPGVLLVPGLSTCNKMGAMLRLTRSEPKLDEAPLEEIRNRARPGELTVAKYE